MQTTRLRHWSIVWQICVGGKVATKQIESSGAYLVLKCRLKDPMDCIHLYFSVCFVSLPLCVVTDNRWGQGLCASFWIMHVHRGRIVDIGSVIVVRLGRKHHLTCVRVCVRVQYAWQGSGWEGGEREKQWVVRWTDESTVHWKKKENNEGMGRWIQQVYG